MNNMYIYGKPKEGFMSRNHFNELSPCEALIMKLIVGGTTGHTCAGTY